jgi:hypothetical protein
MWATSIWFIRRARCNTSPILPPLHELAELGAPDLAWSRMALSEGDEVRSVQVSRLSENLPGPMPAGFADAPCGISRNEAAHREFMAAHSDRYDLIARFNEPSVGFLFLRR